MINVEEVILQNEKLIYSIMKYFGGYSNKDDLFQAGCLGVVMAARNFDASYNIKFTTYAYNYILGEMKKVVREDKSLKINRSLQALSLKIEKANVHLMQKLMRNPTYDELASFLEIPIELVEQALCIPTSVKSIDESIGENNELSLHEVIGYENRNRDELIMLRDELCNLMDQERFIIEKRYLDGLTQQETADLLGMSQVQVYRAEQKVFTKLKNKMVV